MSRVVMVTGAAGRLGTAVAARFAAQGDRLVLVGRHLDPLHAARPSPEALVVVADLADPGATEAALRQARRDAGPVDVLCHLVGGFRMGEAVHETDPSTWDTLLDMNARTFLNVARTVVPDMLERGAGCVVAVGAAGAARGAAGMGAYAASKSALLRLVESMAAELGPRGLNVNAVLPSIIDTPENRAAMPSSDPSRWVDPSALAEVIGFLASEAARAVNGAAIPVTGRG